MPGTRKLGRKTDHRMAMLKGMVTFLLENGKIETTLMRAKEVSALTDKMITVGKQNTLTAKRTALAFLKKEKDNTSRNQLSEEVGVGVEYQMDMSADWI